MAVTVEVRNLTQRFGQTEILHDVSLEIEQGVLGLLGPNGAGKTTLLRTLATIIPPAGGDLTELGLDPSVSDQQREIRRRLGYLPQEFGYYPNFTVFEFVEYVGLLKEIPPARVRAAVVDAIQRVGLDEKARSKLKTLSGGMLRRVGIAQAIVNDPELLLLDEPTAGLDPEQRVSFRELVRKLGTGGTVIVSTHLVEDVAAVCSSVALMDRGRLLFHGKPDELVVRGNGYGVGDSPLERGYSAVLAGERQ